MKKILLILVVMVALISSPVVADYEKLHDWNSVEELKTFLEQDDTDRHINLIAGADGIIRFDGQCEDRAFQLRDRAEAIGKRLETEILDRNEYYKWYRVWIPTNTYHVINKGVIGDNEWWYVEPSTDKIWLGVYLD